MGMFDSFYCNVICPRCGEKSLMELQTKEFECGLKHWHEGSVFNSESPISIVKGVVKDCLGGCNSQQCRSQEKEESGYNSGFGMGVLADVLIENGLVLTATNVRES